MPKINLYEQDLTTAGGLNASSNVVYIPGAVKKYKLDKSDPRYDATKPDNNYTIVVPGDGTLPYRFNSVSEFKEAFKNPATNKFEYLKIAGGNIEKDGFTYVTAERSQQYALAVLQAGLPIIFDVVAAFENDVNAEEAQTLIGNKISSSIFDKLKDRNNYGDVKFITTGGYPNYSKTQKLYSDYMLGVIASGDGNSVGRQDCIALIDHEENKKFDDIKDFFKDSAVSNGKYGAMFTPWCTFQFSSQETFNNPAYKLNSINMPGSLAYLLAFGTSINNNNPNWLAAAGASRGIIPNLIAPLENLTEAQIDKYSLTDSNYIGTAINPIAKINPYGVIIWGNRTLHQGVNGLIASSFLNIRQLCNDIKKTLYVACKSITFEQNSDILWIKFKSMITPLLDQMQTSNGISGYKITKKKSMQKATLTAVIRIYPIEAVENFEITLELADEGTNVIDNL